MNLGDKGMEVQGEGMGKVESTGKDTVAWENSAFRFIVCNQCEQNWF